MCCPRSYLDPLIGQGTNIRVVSVFFPVTFTKAFFAWFLLGKRKGKKVVRFFSFLSEALIYAIHWYCYTWCTEVFHSSGSTGNGSRHFAEQLPLVSDYWVTSSLIRPKWFYMEGLFPQERSEGGGVPMWRWACEESLQLTLKQRHASAGSVLKCVACTNGGAESKMGICR